MTDQELLSVLNSALSPGSLVRVVLVVVFN